MSTLENTVCQVVTDFITNENLFTALDVSNAVKASEPLARHREIRDLVRNLFTTMQSSGYAKTPIKVQLADGSQVDALLYHPVSDTWDLDVKYDAQKRVQLSVTPTMTTMSSVTAARAPKAPVAAPVSVPSVSVMSNVPVAVNAPAVTVPPNTPVTISDPKQLWDSLFTGVKLFPTS